MKILYYSPHPNINYSAPSGPGTHIREVIQAFEEHGHIVVRLICGGEEMNVSAPIQFKKSTIKRFIPSFVWQSLKDYKLIRLDNTNRKRLANFIERERPDLIYERSYYLMSSGYETAKQFGIRYFCEVNAPYPQEKIQMEGRSLFIGAANRNEKKQVEEADKVFTVSSAMKDYLVRKSGCDPNKIVVTPNAVNDKKNHISNELVAAIRKKYDIKLSDRVIGFVGSIFPYHGVSLLLQTFTELIQQGDKKSKLMIVGDGEILSELKLFASQNIEAGRVIFTGNVPHEEVYNYIALMDITVMARSNWYGSPVKIFEYGAMGKVIIAPSTIPVQDVMTHLEDGLLIQNNEAELKAAIDFLIHNPEKASSMAASFQKKVMAQHTWYDVANRILDKVV